MTGGVKDAKGLKSHSLTVDDDNAALKKLN
jgi:hypothetical protein